MKCKEGALKLIDRIVDTIELISNEEYRMPLDIYNDSTLAKHFRHIYDFFNCIIEQKDRDVVDYSLRDRDVRLEEDKEYAINHFELLKKRLKNMEESQPVSVKADFELSDGQRPIVHTTIGREIMYGYDHAVHHLAIVKIGIKSLNPDIPVHKDLGVAASTLRHQSALPR